MKKIYLRLPSSGKIYFFPQEKEWAPLKTNEEILVEVDNLIESAIVVDDGEASQTAQLAPGKIIRCLTPSDRQKILNLQNQARGFIEEVRKKAFRHGLKMKILDAELSFDEKKLTFYFCAEGRLDFRSLVYDLVKSYGKIIRLQQIGARDEAKIYGGFGKCGRELCCQKFLANLESITLEMAQMQELATAGSAKLSGGCGKLMCCLAFEAEAYEDLKKKLPKIGSKITTKEGSGKVLSQSILEGKVMIETEEGKKEVFL